jgi:hypothetical protein
MNMKEEWKEFPLGYKTKFRYAVSNFGQLRSFTDDISKGQTLKCGQVDGYKIFRYSINKTKKRIHKHMLIHKLVATLFLPDREENQKYVLHLDYNPKNNRVDNLKWATKLEAYRHTNASPAARQARKKLVEFNRQRDGHKLTVTRVLLIKKILADPNRKIRMKMLAKRFGITEQTIYRIKWGENWGHVQP